MAEEAGPCKSLPELAQALPLSPEGMATGMVRCQVCEHPYFGWCRLNYRLSTACQNTITEKCADACASTSIEQPCGGTVLRCLTEKIEEITDDHCKKEVFYFQKMEVRDFRNDVILAENCRSDVDQFCANVEPGDFLKTQTAKGKTASSETRNAVLCIAYRPLTLPGCAQLTSKNLPSPAKDRRLSAGEGRVHKCLWDNKDKLSKGCRSQEIKIQIMQSSNTELMPNLAKACRAEREAHCKGVRAGKSRVYNCLVSNSDSVGLSFLVSLKAACVARLL